LTQLEWFSQFVTDNKKRKIDQVLEHRTRRLTLVLEDIFQPHNASATLRTAEILGIQDIHIIENNNSYNINPDVVLGSAKWVDLHRYNQQSNNTTACIAGLKEQGYTIVAATPHQKSVGLDDLDLSHKHAIMFGTELTGLSDLALAQADLYLQLPMYGFTQSFNISVTVAMVLSYLVKQLHENHENWTITHKEKNALTLSWYKKICGKKNKALEEEWRQRYGK
jgi:tRNA (guanosine-2'-O-)-methyltransferase